MIPTAGRQRPFVRLALIVLGTTAAGGASAVVRPQPSLCLVGFAIGFLAFVVAERLGPRPPEIDPLPAAPAPASFWLAFMLGCGLCLAAGINVRRAGLPFATHVLWVLGLAALGLAAFLAWRRVVAPPEADRRSRRTILLTLLLMAAVGTVSFGWDLTAIPPEVHGDEGEEGLDAVRLIEQKPFNLFTSGWYDLPRFHVLRQAVAFQLFGVNLFALRCTSVVLGVASVLLLFGLTYELWGFEAAVVAALVLATARFFIHLSRTGYSYIDAPFYSVLIAWLFVVGWRRLTLGAAVCCGIAIGLAMQTYFAARLIPLLLTITWLLWLARKPSSWRAQVTFFAVIVVSAMATAAPAIAFFGDHANELWSRTRDTSVFSEGAQRHLAFGYGTSNLYEILGIQLRKAVTAIHLTGDTSLQYGYSQPMLDIVSGALFVLGLGVLCARPLLRRNQMALLWTAVPLIAGGALTIDTPFYPRMGGMIPFVAVVVTVALHRIVDDIRGAVSGSIGRVASGLVAVATVAAIVFINIQTYFFDYAPNHRHGPAVEIAAWIRANGAGKTAYMIGGLPGYSINHGTIRILTYGYAKADVPDLDTFVHGHHFDPAHSIFIVMPSAHDRLATLTDATGPLDVVPQQGYRNMILFYGAIPAGAPATAEGHPGA